MKHGKQKTWMIEIMKKKIDRIYHHYHDWEEVDYNMWGKIDDREKYLEMAVNFTGDHERYGKAMMSVAREWKNSCEHNLTNLGQNRRAWIGHAACAFAFGCPEDIVREAWWKLSDGQRELADAAADRAIEFWEKCHLEGLCQSED